MYGHLHAREFAAQKSETVFVPLVKAASMRGRPPRMRRGFTLIELLVVFTLVALLLTIAVPRYLTTTETAREKVRAQNMATLRDAIDKFKADQGRYPTELADLVGKQYLRS